MFVTILGGQEPGVREMAKMWQIIISFVHNHKLNSGSTQAFHYLRKECTTIPTSHLLSNERTSSRCISTTGHCSSLTSTRSPPSPQDVGSRIL